MGTRSRSFTREERIKLLEGYEVSGMNIKDYAQGKGIGVSTLYKWSSQLRMPLRGSEKAFSVVNEMIKPDSESFLKEKQKRYKETDVFLQPPLSGLSFIDITSQMGKNPVSSSQQSAQSINSRGLEIRLPSGVTLKIEKAPFNHVWIRVVEWVRALG